MFSFEDIFVQFLQLIISYISTNHIFDVSSNLCMLLHQIYIVQNSLTFSFAIFVFNQPITVVTEAGRCTLQLIMLVEIVVSACWITVEELSIIQARKWSFLLYICF